MRFCVLASGSRGNSIYIETASGCYLVDIGVSAKETERRLAEKGLSPNNVDAIIITHAHGDHVRGVSVFANRYKLPIYANPETLYNIKKRLKPGQITHPVEGEFTLNDTRFTPFPVPHDCKPTFGYLIADDEFTFAVCADLGYATGEVKKHLSKANAMLLESNHDPDMLQKSAYPWDLKERISGRFGHLSNQQAGELLKEVIGPHVKYVVLGHLSLANNSATVARRTVIKYVGEEYAHRISVLEQKNISRIFVL